MRAEFATSYGTQERQVACGAEEVVWCPPNQDNLKLNTYAAFDVQTGLATIGVVVCDCIGNVRLSAVQRLNWIASALQAEVLAIRFGLDTACHHSFQNIVLESDCLVAIKEIDKGFSIQCGWGAYVFDILSLSPQLQACSFKHIKRSGNFCSHNLCAMHRWTGVEQF